MARKTSLLFLIALLLAAVLTFVIWQQWQGNQREQKERQHKPPLVTYLTVKRSTIRSPIEATGSAKADESVTITANVTDHVETFYFDDGAYVEKGALLVQLKTNQQEAQLADAQARLDDAEKQYKRNLSLSKRDYLAQSQLDTQEATLKSAQARVKELQANIEDRKIRAPFSGVLGFRKISEGALVEPGDEIVTLDAINPIKVDFTLPEKYLNMIHENQDITATSIAFPNKLFKGKIKVISSRIDVNTRTFTARALIDNPDNLLRPGMHLQIHVLQTAQPAILIPEAALVPIDNIQYVYVLQPNQQAKRVEVTTGPRSNGQVAIVDGLNPGDKIIVDGGFKLQPNQTVRAIPHTQQDKP